MIEHDKYPSDLQTSCPLKDMRTAAGADGLHASMRLHRGGKTITAPEFQYELMTAAADYGRQHGAPDYEIELAELSAEIAADLPNEATHDKWQGHVEHIGKKYHLQRYLDKTGIDISHTKAIGFDLLWNNISYGGLVANLRKQGKIALMPHQSCIDAARHTPPDPTRAKVRGRLVDYASKTGRAYSHMNNWHLIKTYDKENNLFSFQMNDPWDHTSYPQWYDGPVD
jgi:proteasome accessory factor A